MKFDTVERKLTTAITIYLLSKMDSETYTSKQREKARQRFWELLLLWQVYCGDNIDKETVSAYADWLVKQSSRYTLENRDIYLDGLPYARIARISSDEHMHHAPTTVDKAAKHILALLNGGGEP